MADIAKLVEELSKLTVMEAAEVFFGQSTHVYRPQRRRSETPRVGLASLDGLEETG